MDEIDPCLLWLLRRAGDEWGPLGVAVAAARLSDPNAVIAHLQGVGPRRRREDFDLPRDDLDPMLPRSPDEEYQP